MPLPPEIKTGKVCRNKQCANYQAIVVTDKRRCSMCESKLKALKDFKPGVIPQGGTVNTNAHHPDCMCDSCRDKGEVQTNSHVGKSVPITHRPVGFGPSDNYRTRGPENPSYQDNRRPAQQQGNDVFECDDDVKDCPVAKNKQPIVVIPMLMFSNWIFLAKKFDHEWMAYLKGEEKEGVYVIHEMYFPKQIVAAASVEADDGQIQPDTIGAVHSHVGMGVFFSGCDDKHANHTVELVVNNKGEMACNVRVKLECNRFQRSTGRVMFTADNELVESLEKVIRKRQYAQAAASSTNDQNSLPTVYRDKNYMKYQNKTEFGHYRYCSDDCQIDHRPNWMVEMDANNPPPPPPPTIPKPATPLPPSNEGMEPADKAKAVAAGATGESSGNTAAPSGPTAQINDPDDWTHIC